MTEDVMMDAEAPILTEETWAIWAVAKRVAVGDYAAAARLAHAMPVHLLAEMKQSLDFMADIVANELRERPVDPIATGN